MGEPYSGLVLLVDDDAELRRCMRDFLQNSGCAVLEARDAYDGLFMCAQYGSSINVLVTELNLLPVGGVKLAENALKLWPTIQVLCTSTDADMKGVGYWMRYLNAEYLPKPFSPFQLHEKVFSLMGNRMEDALMPVLDFEPPQREFDPRQIQERVGTLHPATNMEDPLFWLREF